MTHFQLQLPESDLAAWAGRYAYPGEDHIEFELAPAARARGWLTYDEFVAICRWKTPRSGPRCASNPPDLVEEVTRVALAAHRDELKIGALLVLAGVQWPTASVILHFCDCGRYPILDYRALWSLGFTRPPTYTLAFWAAYCHVTRELATRTGLSMRVLDRALWQYSKENQRR